MPLHTDFSAMVQGLMLMLFLFAFVVVFVVVSAAVDLAVSKVFVELVIFVSIVRKNNTHSMMLIARLQPAALRSSRTYFVKRANLCAKTMGCIIQVWLLELHSHTHTYAHIIT